MQLCALRCHCGKGEKLMTPDSLRQDFAVLLREANEPAECWRGSEAVVWAKDRPLCRSIVFHWYQRESQTLRAHVERLLVRWPRANEFASSYPDALRLEFSFHATETALVLAWLRDLCLRRNTPLLESNYVVNLERIRKGSRYEWTDRGWAACEAVNEARALASGRPYEVRRNRPPDT